MKKKQRLKFQKNFIFFFHIQFILTELAFLDKQANEQSGYAVHQVQVVCSIRQTHVFGNVLQAVLLVLAQQFVLQIPHCQFSTRVSMAHWLDAQSTVLLVAGSNPTKDHFYRSFFTLRYLSGPAQLSYSLCEASAVCRSKRRIGCPVLLISAAGAG